jgi:hypothetical protein
MADERQEWLEEAMRVENDVISSNDHRYIPATPTPNMMKNDESFTARSSNMGKPRVSVTQLAATQRMHDHMKGFM